MPLPIENCDAVVNPQKPRNSPDIGSVAVMAATRTDLFLLADLLPFNKNEFERIFISRRYDIPHRPEGFSVTSPFVGAPYAVIHLYQLVDQGPGDIRDQLFHGVISFAEGCRTNRARRSAAFRALGGAGRGSLLLQEAADRVRGDCPLLNPVLDAISFQ